MSKKANNKKIKEKEKEKEKGLVCPNCGNAIAQDAYYCQSCGLEVDIFLYYHRNPPKDIINDMKQARRNFPRVVLFVSGIYLLILLLIYIFYLK